MGFLGGSYLVGLPKSRGRRRATTTDRENMVVGNKGLFKRNASESRNVLNRLSNLKLRHRPNSRSGNDELSLRPDSSLQGSFLTWTPWISPISPSSLAHFPI